MSAPMNSVAMHGNVTQCQAVVASCFDFSDERNKVVYTHAARSGVARDLPQLVY
jgi:hypothetical protein